MQPHLRVLVGFAKGSDSGLLEVAMTVHLKLYGNPLYPNPPVTAAALKTAIDDFSAAIAAANLGGPEETADKNNKREILIGLLRQLAGYVQGLHNNNLADLLSSGFDAVSTNNAPSPLTAPSIKAILNGMSTQLILRITAVPNAKCYEVRYALIPPGGAPGPYQTGGLHTNSRNMAINDLIPGGNYQFQVRAVGGSTGYSDWSDPVSHRCL